MDSRNVWFHVFLFIVINVLFSISLSNGAYNTYMENSLKDYFSKPRHHEVDQAYKDRSMKFIHDEFKRFGMETEYHEFHDPRVSDTLNFTNVVGILKGERFGQLDDRILAIGAHYDTVNITSGVDDNGAGCAAVLEVARQITEMDMAGIKRQNTIIFISWDVEEMWTFASGSEKFVSEWLLPFLQKTYGSEYKTMKPHGIVVLDMPMEYNATEGTQTIIGPVGAEKEFAQYFPTVYSNMEASNFKGDWLALTYRDRSVDVPLAESFISEWGMAGRPKFKLETFPLPVLDVKLIETHPILHNFLRSDHTPFWWEDFPAIFMMDTANFRGDGAYCYHQPCDDIEHYLTEDNVNFLGKTVDSIVQVIHKLSEPQASKSNGSPTVATSSFHVMLPGIVAVFFASRKR